MTYQDIFGHRERQSGRTHSSIVHGRITRTAHRKVINKELHELLPGRIDARWRQPEHFESDADETRFANDHALHT